MNDKGNIYGKDNTCNIPYVTSLRNSVQRLPAVPPKRAADLLSVNKRTVYRWLRDEILERVPHGSYSWVSVRSIAKYMEDSYGKTAAFNLLEDTYTVSVTRMAQVTSRLSKSESDLSTNELE